MILVLKDLFSFLGNALNDDLYKESTKSDISAQDLNLEDLKKSSKIDFYKSSDIRLQSFINSLTERKRSACDNSNFKYNVYENLLKARNSKFNSAVGIKEHMVAYLASGKARHTNQVFSK